MVPTSRLAFAAWTVLCLAGATLPAVAAPAKPKPQPRPTATAKPTAPKPAPTKPAPAKPGATTPKPAVPATKPSTPLSRPLPQPAPAEDTSEPVRRFRIGVYAGGNGLVGSSILVQPVASMSIGYRLPVLDDRLELLLDIGTGGAVQIQASGIGLQYQVADWGPWHPFVGVIGGVTYGLVPPWNGGIAILNPTPMVLGKIGVEWMPLPWLGLETAVSGGYPNIVRGQLGAKLAF